MSWISQKQFEYLKRLSKMNQMPEFQIRVSGNLSSANPRPTKWIPWEKWNWNRRADFYTILPNEIVFDIDASVYLYCDHCTLASEADKLLTKMPAYYCCPHCNNFTYVQKNKVVFAENIKLAKDVETRLNKLGVPFEIYASGGKGLHFETFLKCHGASKNIDWKQIRSEFAEIVLKGINYLVDPAQDKWAIDKTKWNWDESRTKGSLLRLVGGKKVAYKTPLSKVPNYPVFATAPDFPGWIKMHYVQPIERKAKVRSQKYDRKKNYPSYRSKDVDLCVLDMIDQIKAGVHLSHLQNLAVGARCLIAGYSVDQIHEIYSHDPKYLESETNRQIYSVMDMLEREPEKVVSCKTIKERGWCPSEQICKEISQRVRNERQTN